MADTGTGTPAPAHGHAAHGLPDLLAGVRSAWTLVVLIPAAQALISPAAGAEMVGFAAGALLRTAPYILFATLAVAWLKATGAEHLLARAFEGREVRMIVLAAALGGLSPFCSCEVIPFIAALLAVGAPLSAVMAFWLASPLMDPAMFLITAAGLGWDFALAKEVAAIGIGVLGGFGTMLLRASPVFTDPLRPQPAARGCCSARARFSERPVWRFWTLPDRRAAFRETATNNLIFLTKWLSLAYLVEAAMLAHVPAESVARLLGGEGIGTVLLAAAVGAPAYLNGFAAVPLVAGLVEQGMSQGAAMAFVIAGGVSCIPAALAVWALVRPRVFAAYIGFAMTGATAAGLAWQALA